MPRKHLFRERPPAAATLSPKQATNASETRILKIGVGCLMLCVLGCGKQETPDATARHSDSSPARQLAPAKPQPQTVVPRPENPQAAATIDANVATTPATAEASQAQPINEEPALPKRHFAKVELTEGHRELCKVLVGDPMPAITLPDLSGEQQALSNLLGERATIVIFWTDNLFMARQQLADIEPDLLTPFAEQGIEVVTVAVGLSSEAAQQHLADARAMAPTLIDSDGAAFALVGQERLPRTYLLDADGRVVWFDIEYSRSTRRELQAGLQHLLTQALPESAVDEPEPASNL